MGSLISYFFPKFFFKKIVNKNEEVKFLINHDNIKKYNNLFEFYQDDQDLINGRLVINL